MIRFAQPIPFSNSIGTSTKRAILGIVLLIGGFSIADAQTVTANDVYADKGSTSFAYTYDDNTGGTISNQHVDSGTTSVYVFAGSDVSSSGASAWDDGEAIAGTFFSGTYAKIATTGDAIHALTVTSQSAAWADTTGTATFSADAHYVPVVGAGQMYAEHDDVHSGYAEIEVATKYEFVNVYALFDSVSGYWDVYKNGQFQYSTLGTTLDAPVGFFANPANYDEVFCYATHSMEVFGSSASVGGYDVSFSVN